MEEEGKGRDGKGKGKGSGDYVKKVNLKGMELEGRWREVEGRTIDCKVQCGFYGLHLQYRLCPAIQGSHRHIVPKGACLIYIYIYILDHVRASRALRSLGHIGSIQLQRWVPRGGR